MRVVPPLERRPDRPARELRVAGTLAWLPAIATGLEGGSGRGGGKAGVHSAPPPRPGRPTAGHCRIWGTVAVFLLRRRWIGLACPAAGLRRQVQCQGAEDPGPSTTPRRASQRPTLRAGPRQPRRGETGRTRGLALRRAGVSARRPNIRSRQQATSTAAAPRLAAVRVGGVRAVTPDRTPAGGPGRASLKPAWRPFRMSHDISPPAGLDPRVAVGWLRPGGAASAWRSVRPGLDCRRSVAPDAGACRFVGEGGLVQRPPRSVRLHLA